MLEFLLCKENAPYVAICISIASFLWGMISFFLLRTSNKNNVILNDALTDLRNRKHWRNEKIYILSEDLQGLAHSYWLSDADYELDQAIQLKIKSKLQDIEDHAISLGIDITSELSSLRDHITGGLFESPDRKKIAAYHEKFLYIQQAVSGIKSKLP